MKDSAVARRYAAAVFGEAQAKNQVRACQQGLEEFLRVMNPAPQRGGVKLRDSLSNLLQHPFIALNEKQKMIRAALGEYATPLLEHFLALLIEKKRLASLPAIVDEFMAAVDRSQNVQALKVRSAFPLSEARRQTLQRQLQQWLQSGVRLEVEMDPQLIGGFVIQTRDQISDQSVRGQLQRMREQLLSI